jgi:hypothetical protein
LTQIPIIYCLDGYFNGANKKGCSQRYTLCRCARPVLDVDHNAKEVTVNSHIGFFVVVF